jgi:cytochrome c556
MKPAWLVVVLFVLLATFALAQSPADSAHTPATMRQLMLDLIHPASNDILLFVYRGAPKNEVEWAAVRRSTITLSESATLLMTRSRMRDQSDWAKDAKMLADVGAAAYKAAQAKDFTALAALTESLDASCTTCHKQYRPNVFPHNGGATGASK